MSQHPRHDGTWVPDVWLMRTTWTSWENKDIWKSKMPIMKSTWTSHNRHLHLELLSSLSWRSVLEIVSQIQNVVNVLELRFAQISKFQLCLMLAHHFRTSAQSARTVELRNLQVFWKLAFSTFQINDSLQIQTSKSCFDNTGRQRKQSYLAKHCSHRARHARLKISTCFNTRRRFRSKTCPA